MLSALSVLSVPPATLDDLLYLAGWYTAAGLLFAQWKDAVMGTLPQRLAEIGISYRQFDHWCRLGLVDAPGNGSGSVRPVPAAEMQHVAMMGRLTQIGMSPSLAAAASRQIQATGQANIDGILITPITVTHPAAAE